VGLPWTTTTWPVEALAQFPSLWETDNMAKRSLRILKRVSSTPSLGICELCNTQFSADPRQLGQSGVQQQFNAHKCEARPIPAPVVKEAPKPTIVSVTKEKKKTKASKK
jgi:hypothetical protein